MNKKSPSVEFQNCIETLRKQRPSADYNSIFNQAAKDRPDLVAAMKKSIPSGGRHQSKATRIGFTNAKQADAASVLGDTPAQRQAYQDEQTRNAARTETGASGRANIDASQTLAKFRVLESTMERQRPQDRSQQDLQALHDGMERLIGLHENSNVSPGLSNQISQLLRRIDRLERDHRLLDQQFHSRSSGNT